MWFGRVILVVVMVFVSAVACVDPQLDPAPEPAAERLVSNINGLRAERGLDPIAWSDELAVVAQQHVWDLERNMPVEPCNLHSWSADGQWDACCYRDDRPDPTCMVEKPRELSSYAGHGYEIAVELFGPEPLSPERALELWLESHPHRAVILNEHSWADAKWSSVGAAVTEHYAVVWFGEE